MRSSTSLTASFIATVAVSALSACSKPADAPQAAAAPAPAAEVAAAPKPQNAHAFTIGGLSAFALLDGGIAPPNDNQVFGVGRTPEEVAAVLSAAGQPTDKLQLSIQPLLVKSTDRVLLFDSGAASNFGPGNGQLGASLAEAGIDPQSITDIFISHVHGDHVGGLMNAEGALTFPNATIHLSKPEWKFLTGVSDEMAQKMGLTQHAALVAAIKPKVEAFAPGADLVPGVVKAVEVKGHTPGHSAYQIASGQDSLLYVGDSMHHYLVSVQKPEWTNGFDGDGATAAASRAALISQLATSGQRVYAIHFPFPGIGKIEQRGDGFVWAGE